MTTKLHPLHPVQVAAREVVAAHAALTEANLNQLFADKSIDPIPCADRMGRALDALDAATR